MKYTMNSSSSGNEKNILKHFQGSRLAIWKKVLLHSLLNMSKVAIKKKWKYYNVMGKRREIEDKRVEGKKNMQDKGDSHDMCFVEDKNK